MALRVIGCTFAVASIATLLLVIADRWLRIRHQPKTAIPRPWFFSPEPARNRCRAIGALLALVLPALLCIGLILWGDLDPSNEGNAAPSARLSELTRLDAPNHDRFTSALANKAFQEDLQVAVGRNGGPIEKSLGRDAAFIAAAATAFVAAAVVSRSDRRWRPAANFGLLLATAYVYADARENALLRGLLGEARRSAANLEVPNDLTWWSHLKVGAFGGATVFYVLAIGLVIAQITWKPADADPSVAAAEDSPEGEPVGFFEPLRRFGPWARRVLAPVLPASWRPKPPTERPDSLRSEVTTPTSTHPELGISCSGGGIRSASFTLGALQSLDDPPESGAKRSEYERTELVTAVSGGSYMATAWVAARSRSAQEDARPWSRGSAEETFLRRHADYLAPGFNGKAWALVRFVFGLLTNLTLIVGSLAIIGVTAGVYVARATHPADLGRGSKVIFDDGGCIFIDGEWKGLARGATLILTGGAPTVTKARPTPPKEEGSSPTVTASIEVDGDVTASGTLATPGSMVVGEDGDATATLEVPTPAEPDDEDDAPSEKPEPITCPPDDDLNEDAPPAAKATDAGHTFDLAAGGRLLVDGDDVPVCADDSTCSKKQAEVRDIRDRRVATDGGRLQIATDAIRTEDGVLRKACGNRACLDYSVPDGLRIGLLILALGILAGGVSAVLSLGTPAGARTLEIWLRRGVTVLGAAASAFVAVPWLATWAANLRSSLEGELRAATGFGAAAYLAAIGAQVLPLIRPKTTTTSEESAPVKAVKKLGARLRPIFVRVVAAVIGPLVLLATFVGLAAIPVYDDGLDPNVLTAWLWILGLVSLILLGGDLNSWSLHTFYRSRIQSAFAIDRARMVDGESNPIPEEDPLASLSDAGPELRICAAVNLNDPRATAPGRPVTSWTFTRTGIGSGALASPGDGFMAPVRMPHAHLASAWTAVAVSGAAFSPAMGKMSRPERSLLAIANLRLGLWYPNPRWMNKEDGTWYDTRRMARPWYLIKEMVGRHRVDDPWVYVTDGGHYENLGLVELLRAGCKEIYCLDAAGDQTDTFGTFSDAARLARAELGIEIHLDPTPLKPGKDGLAPTGVLAGWFERPANDNGMPRFGWIVLAKLVVPKGAPHDIVDLARTVPGFPTHPTTDQLYTDQKFEAYRALGEHLGASMAETGRRLRSALPAAPGAQEMRAAVKAANEALVPPPSNPPASKVELSGRVRMRG